MASTVYNHWRVACAQRRRIKHKLDRQDAQVQRLLDRLMREIQRNTFTPFTKREQQVFDLLTRGRTNQEIALGIPMSYRAVKSHVHNILRKTGALRRTELIRIAK